MFQPSHLPEIQIWLVSGYSRLIESRKKNESLQHKSTRWRCEILRKWTTIASSKTWVGPATCLWTCCPRQAWPRSSLIIKHYRVQVGNHHRGYRSLVHYHGLTLNSFSRTNPSVAWGAKEHIWNGGCKSPNHRILSHVCMTDLGWFQRKQNNLSQIHGGNFHQMHVYKRKSLLSSNKYFMS